MKTKQEDPYDAALRRLKALAGVSPLVDDARDSVRGLEQGQLRRWFVAEGDAVRAVLLCLVAPAARGPLLVSLPEAQRASVVAVLGRLQEVSRQALEAIVTEAHARQDDGGGARRGNGFGPRSFHGDGDASAGIAHVAALLQGVDASFATALLEKVEGRDPALAAAVRKGMLDIPRLAELFVPDRQRLLCAVPDATLCLFLLGVLRLQGKALYNRFLEVFSSARRADIDERVLCLGKVPRTKIDEASALVIEKARTLRAEGLISFPWEEAWVS